MALVAVSSLEYERLKASSTKELRNNKVGINSVANVSHDTDYCYRILSESSSSLPALAHGEGNIIIMGQHFFSMGKTA